MPDFWRCKMDDGGPVERPTGLAPDRCKHDPVCRTLRVCAAKDDVELDEENDHFDDPLDACGHVGGMCDCYAQVARLLELDPHLTPAEAYGVVLGEL